MSDKADRRRGVAIVIVLGLMSLLMVMAVAFAISMRVERTSAGNYAYTVYARQFIWAGLARAMACVNESMTTNGRVAMAPDWGVLASSGSGDSVPLAWGEALDYIPDGLTNAAVSTNACWENVEDTNNVIVGRCAYLVVNCSGLLDANKVGGAPRGLGTNSWEIQLDRLSDVSSVPAFTNDRNYHVRYETLRELIHLNRGLSGCENFCTYVMAPEQKYLRDDGSATLPKAWIGGTAGEILSNRVAIMTALADSGVSDAGARGTAFTNILDYVDADCIPCALNVGTTEKIPMINEAVVEGIWWADGGGNYTVDYALYIEWFYPLDTPTSDRFLVEMNANFTPDPGNTYNQLVPAALTHSETVPAAGTLSYGYGTLSVEGSASGGGLGVGSNINVRFTANVKAQVKFSGQVVDSVPWPYSGQGLTLRFDFVIPAGGGTVRTQEWAECVDPRFNWDTQNKGSPFQWGYSELLRGIPGVPAASSLGKANELLKYLLATDPETHGYGINFDGDTPESATRLFVANRPIKSVGELGFITIRPWQTIRLYDHNFAKPQGSDPPFHRVLDCFTCFRPSVTYRRGLVNLNSTNREVLAAVFYGIPAKEYVSPIPPADRITWANALAIADAVTNNRPYMNAASIGQVTNWADFVSGVSDIERESPIRNAAGLLTARHNLFTVLLASGAASRGMGIKGSSTFGGWLSYQRAVAEVWRDPYPTITTVGGRRYTNNYWFVRSMKFLDD